MGCGMSKQSLADATPAKAGPAIKVYGPTYKLQLGPNEREDSVVFDEEIWREYYNRQALKNRNKEKKKH